MPQGIRLQRRAGWRLPATAKSVAYPTRWQNPFRPETRSIEANAVAVEQFRRWLLEERPELVAVARVELAGYDLACWCPIGYPCHREDWLRIVAGDEP